MRLGIRDYHQMLCEKLGPHVRAYITAGELVELFDELDQLRKFKANEPLSEELMFEKSHVISVAQVTA